MGWVAVMILIYFWGVGNHFWPTPLHVMTSVWSGMTNRWSDADDDTDDGTDDMSCQDGDDWVETTDDDGRTRVIQRPVGPLPLDELLGDEDGDDDLPDRIEWVAQQMRDHRRSTDIDQVGADLYGVTQRTIARDRRDLAHRAAARRDRGTMNRRDQ